MLVHNTNGAGDLCEIPISKSKYPESAQHIEDAQAAGQPTDLTIDRAGAAARRAQSMQGNPRVPGTDRDEYPPAMSEEGVLVQASVRLRRATIVVRDRRWVTSVADCLTVLWCE